MGWPLRTRLCAKRNAPRISAVRHQHSNHSNNKLSRHLVDTDFTLTTSVPDAFVHRVAAFQSIGGSMFVQTKAASLFSQRWAAYGLQSTAMLEVICCAADLSAQRKAAFYGPQSSAI